MNSVTFATALLFAVPSLLSAGPSSIPWPVGISPRKIVYDSETNADSVTGYKPGWTSISARDPKPGWWHSQEHGIGKTSNDRYIIFSQETNRAYYQQPGASFEEGINFVQLNSGFPFVAGTPVKEAGYWRGNFDFAQRYVWAPMMFEDSGTFYLYYTSEWEVAPGDLRRGCFLATSTTGDASLSAWVQYDPDPDTPEVEPLFYGENANGFRDFHVIRVQTGDGPRFYMYYIANPDYEPLGVPISEVRMRSSDSLTNWPQSTEHVAFRKINDGITHPSRLFVDYENPVIVQYDANNFFLFIARHGSYPADIETNPDWVPISLHTEVFWSADGLTFDPANQGPNLTDGNGRVVNAPEIIHEGNRWFATHAGLQKDINKYPFDVGPDYNTHSEELTRLVSTFDEEDSNIQIFEFTFGAFTATTSSWVVY